MKVLDYTGTSHLVSKTKTELAKKVDKVTGKGLSTNDYTNAEKQKVADSLTDAPSDGKQYARQDGDWEELDLDGKANIDGYYDTLSVGLADNLIDRKGNGTPQEISYRTSCGDDSIADDGNGIIQSIFGKTVVWNQLVPSEAIGSGGTLNVDGGVYTLTPNISSGYSEVRFYNATPHTRKAGHKYYVSIEVKSNAWASDENIGFCTYDGLWLKAYLTRIDPSNHSWQNLKGIVANTTDASGNGEFCFRKYYEETNSPVSIKNAILIDLTQLFGSGNEPTTVDDPRIEWIKDYATAHPEYNSGELVSYNGSGIKTVGFNQWDEEWEVGTIAIANGAPNPSTTDWRSKNYINAFPNTDYHIHNGGATNTFVVYYYDADKNYISYNFISTQANELAFTTPNETRYIKFVLYQASTHYGMVYNHDININLSWSGYRNGEYDPYWSRTLNLPISTYFPDGMKSAGSVRDEMTKDKAVKRIGEVTYTGGFLPNAISGDYLYLTYANDDLPVCTNDDVNVRCVSDLFTGVSASNRLYNKNTIYVISDKRFMVCVSTTDFADANAFNTYLSNNPVTIYYELAEPIETAVTPPLDLTYKVADFGTEESIAEGKSTPFNGIIKYSDDFTRGLVNMPKNYDTTVSLDALATSLSTMLTSALDGTVTITRGAYDSTNKTYAWNCSFIPNA